MSTMLVGYIPYENSPLATVVPSSVTVEEHRAVVASSLYILIVVLVMSLLRKKYCHKAVIFSDREEAVVGHAASSADWV